MALVSFFKKKYYWFAGLAISIFLIFFSFRPLNSPQYRIIVADGLGYYAYLPAQFIYHDTELKFEWFDTIFDANYDNHLFEKPSQNFMVKYGDRMINLYYPGQSLLQAPFFLAGHVAAKILHYPSDGFSLPYQLAIGIAGLFYTLLGLFFCHQLLLNIFQNRPLSILIPLLIFFGTNLFTYSIFAGCYTHTYSFCFVTLCLYFSERFFNSSEHKIYFLLLLKLCAIIVITLRPLNGILLISILYFFKPFTLKDIFRWRHFDFRSFILILIILMVLTYSARILYTQTHSIIANTYTIGRFYFNDWSHVYDNFIGFQNGILWYTPLIFLCFLPVLFVIKHPRITFLLTPVLLIILVYSFWFYWNIVNRTLVDFSGILAILLLLLLNEVKNRTVIYKTLLILAFLAVPFYQLKAFQLRNGILNNNYTYWHYYAKYFFTTHHVDVFPVNPKTIIKEENHYFDFEKENSNEISSKHKFEGERSAALNKDLEYSCTKTFKLPRFFDQEGFKKVKASFWFYRTKEIKNIQIIFSFDKKDSVVSYIPFYINETTAADQWELKEFGLDLPEGLDTTSHLTIYFWNPDKQQEAFIDNLKLEFILKNGSDEINWK